MTADEDLGAMLDRYRDAHGFAYQAMQHLRDACRDELEAAEIAETEDERLTLHVGPILVFFRVAYEADGEAYVEYGHYERSEEGLLLELADGEWEVSGDLPDRLAGDGAGGRIHEALEEVRDAVAESSSGRRIVNGIVDGIVSPARRTKEYRR